MENEKEKKHFIIWLYISILLHLLMVVIMLSIKPTSSTSTDPDPAGLDYDATKILFVEDKPDALLPDEPKPQPQMATRIQGGPTISTQDSPAEPKPIQQDVPEQALSDQYKKSMRNQTNIKDQDEHGQVNIAEDAIIDQVEQPEKQIIAPTQAFAALQAQDKPTVDAAPTHVIATPQAQEKHISSAEILKNAISQLSKATVNKEEKTKQVADDEEPLQPLVQKIVSIKHRSAELGLENSSKIQLSKQPTDLNPPKKKLSLQDLQSGFSQFLQHGNEQYYSTQGNAQFDDAEALKRASYYRQLGQMYKNAHAIAPNLVHGSQHEQPTNNSIVQITIERSGNISNQHIITSCGIDSLDRHHTRIIESIGSFPPIPKYIEAPLQITATLRFFGDRSSSGTFAPVIRRK